MGTLTSMSFLLFVIIALHQGLHVSSTGKSVLFTYSDNFYTPRWNKNSEPEVPYIYLSVFSPADHTSEPCVKWKKVESDSAILTSDSYSLSQNTSKYENTPKQEAQNQTCETQECLDAALNIIKNMDDSVNPCDNFYRFACGTYIQLAELFGSSASVLGEGYQRLAENLKESIEKINGNDSRTLRLLKSHYNSCLDVGNIKKTSETVLSNILNKLGGWPIVVGESWNGSTFDWKKVIYQLRQMGYRKSMQSLVRLTLKLDEKNNTRLLITMDQAELGLPLEYLSEGMENEMVKAYYDYMVNVSTALGVEKEYAKKELSDSLKFEIQLAQISLSNGQRRGRAELYNPITADKLEEEYPGTPWREYINEFLKPQYTMKSNELIIVRNPNYLKNISQLISATPKRVLANYIIWRVIQESIPFMSRKFLNLEAQFDSHATGSDEQLPRKEKCTSYVQDHFDLAIGALYVKKAFNDSFKAEGEKLVENLRRIMKSSLEKNTWMDENTKKAALKKLESLYALVAYPPELLNDEILDKYFENLKLTPDNFLDSYLSINRFDLDTTNQLLQKTYNRTMWITHGNTAVMNAFYVPYENSLSIPAGFFQEELFSTSKPNYMNYAGMGYFIGHELTHAFDDLGKQFDEEGNLKNWWDPDTQQKYQERAKCILEQYNNYTVQKAGLKVNGANTLGENIADNGGLKQAYLAYEEYEKQNGPELRLPGLDYSPRQLFWLSNANAFCEVSSPESATFEVLSSDHSPSEYRVIGTLSNMPEFARDFNCPVGSFMNPVKKCSFW